MTLKVTFATSQLYLVVGTLLSISVHAREEIIRDYDVLQQWGGINSEKAFNTCDSDSRPWRKYETTLESLKRSIIKAANESVVGNLIGCSNQLRYADSFESMILDYRNVKQIPKLFENPVVAIVTGSNSELHEYLIELPYTLTRANDRLGNATQKGNPNVAKKWASGSVIWQLPPTHPRNALRNECVALSFDAGQHAVNIYTNRSAALEPFYIVKLSNVFIHDTGIIGLECGYWQAHEGCETIFRFLGQKWRAKCDESISRAGKSWRQFLNDCRNEQFTHENYYGCPTEIVTFRAKKPRKYQPTLAPTLGRKPPLPSYHQQVFAITSSWDNNYHHFIVDCLIRIIRFMDFIQENPQMKIHIRTFERFTRKERLVFGSIAMRERILNLLGIDKSRLINGSVVADEVFVPRTAKCNSQVSHALELRLLAKYMLSKAFKCPNASAAGSAVANSAESLTIHANNNSSSIAKRKKLILQHRHCLTKSDCDATWREWDTETFESVKTEFSLAFIHHEIVTMSSSDTKSVECLACQIHAYSQADVIVGIHGAGMTNVMFMQPGSLLVEIVGQFDGRMLPLCGYHGPLNSVFGVHHYIYYYDWKANAPLDPSTIAKEASEFYKSQHKN